MPFNNDIYLKNIKINSIKEMERKLMECGERIELLLSNIMENDYSQGEFQGKNQESYMENLEILVANMKKSCLDTEEENAWKIKQHIQTLEQQVFNLQSQMSSSSFRKGKR